MNYVVKRLRSVCEAFPFGINELNTSSIEVQGSCSVAVQIKILADRAVHLAKTFCDSAFSSVKMEFVLMSRPVILKNTWTCVKLCGALVSSLITSHRHHSNSNSSSASPVGGHSPRYMKTDNTPAVAATTTKPQVLLLHNNDQLQKHVADAKEIHRILTSILRSCFTDQDRVNAGISEPRFLVTCSPYRQVISNDGLNDLNLIRLRAEAEENDARSMNESSNTSTVCNGQQRTAIRSIRFPCPESCDLTTSCHECTASKRVATRRRNSCGDNKSL
jgi:hypothetical protein